MEVSDFSTVGEVGAGGQSQLYGVVTEFIYPSAACNFRVQNRAKIVN